MINIVTKITDHYASSGINFNIEGQKLVLDIETSRITPAQQSWRKNGNLQLQRKEGSILSFRLELEEYEDGPDWADPEIHYINFEVDISLPQNKVCSSWIDATA